MVHCEVFYVGFYYFFIYTRTYQVRCFTAHRNEMFYWRMSSNQSINLSVLMNNSDTFPVTDINTTVNTDSNSLGKCQSGLCSRPSIPAPKNI